MMKSPRGRRFALRWLGSTTASVGVAGGLMAFAPGIEIPLGTSVGILLVCVVGAGSYSWLSTKPVHLPIDALAPLALSKKPAVTLETVRDRGILYAVNDLARTAYPGVQPMSCDRYEQYLLVNANILCALLSSERRVLGYFDVFPLREGFGNAFLEGAVGEQDLRHEHLMASDRAHEARILYLGGIAVRDPETYAGQRAASQLVWGMLRYLEAYYPSSHISRRLVASAATTEGENLLTRFQFQMVLPATLAKDRCALYAVSLASPALQIARSSLPDWSPLCRVTWEEGELEGPTVGVVA